MTLSPIKIKLFTWAKKIMGEKRAIDLLSNKYISTYKKKKIIFVHIPKAAGTSVATALYGKRNGHLKASFIREKMGMVYSDYFSFSVSRNPYDRIVSSYKFARQGQTQDGAVKNPKFYENDIFQSFGSFLREWLVKQDLTKVDLIFQPQHTFIFENDVCLVNNLFKLEEMELVEVKLSEQMKKEIKIGNRNRTRASVNNADYYTQELKDIVYNLYRKDFELLGYQR